MKLDVKTAKELAKTVSVEPPDPARFAMMQNAAAHIRQQLEGLSDEDRAARMETLGAELLALNEKYMEDFFAKSEAEQQAQLDQTIDAMKRGGGPVMITAGSGSSYGASSRLSNTGRLLDMTSPELRARMDEYNRKLAERRRQRS